jgi:hypothetical protein
MPIPAEIPLLPSADIEQAHERHHGSAGRFRQNGCRVALIMRNDQCPV